MGFYRLIEFCSMNTGKGCEQVFTLSPDWSIFRITSADQSEIGRKTVSWREDLESVFALFSCIPTLKSVEISFSNYL